jgi:hypothetical protein
MSVLNKISFFQEKRDEAPNQELAKELAQKKDAAGIREIAENLWNKNNHVRSDCLKVLYEIGYINPELISPYADDFLKLLVSKQNRLVWGGMIALSTIASRNAAKLFEKRELICKTIEAGSIITIDNGIKTLAAVAAADEDYKKELAPYLFTFLTKCRLSDVPRHAENMLICVNTYNKVEFLKILQERQPEMTPSQSARVKKIQKSLN